MTVAFGLGRQCFHAFARDQPRALVVRGLHEPVGPAFESEAVDDDEFRAGDGLGVRRGRLETMHVRVRADERRDLHALAADLAHEIAEDREAREHFDLLLGLILRLRRQRERGGGKSGEKQFAHDAVP